MGILDFLGKNKITMGLFKMSFKKMNDEQKEDFIFKAINKLASGEEKLPDNPQMKMIIKQWKGMSDWQKKQMVKMIAPKMAEAIEKGEFDQMMGGMG
ncbi:hypothetical protein KKB43_02550 [Patescibacteria group bacterium]|nr:hypothetical protein [Patescibacteria group bacterium]MBU4338579.1 hypothetical protein [Patescibacteria group bacterium]MBU4579872.1 hypothetical protein [Patescibacteria group bacterium]